MVNYFMPETLHEALHIIDEHECIILAGGTDLMIKYRSTAETPPAFQKDVCFLSQIKELKYIKKDHHFIHVGAMTTLEELMVSPVIPNLFKQVINDIAAPGIRHTATLAGNIGNASPAGDTLPYLYAIQAFLCIESIHEKKMVPIQEVILGVRRTSLKENEIIKEIMIPIHDFSVETWTKVGPRKADTISKISFIGMATIDQDIIKDFRIAFGAVDQKIVCRDDINQKLIGKLVTDYDYIDQILSSYEPLIKPIDDHRSTKVYRKEVALNLLKDFLQKLKGEI